MPLCLGLRPSPVRHFKSVSLQAKKPAKCFNLSIRNSSRLPENAHKLVAEVKEKLRNGHSRLPVGKHGRDDEEMILWFLKDGNYSVKVATSKLAKAIRWRHEFGVLELTEESVKTAAQTGKAYVHDHLDVYGRPVLIGNLSKHIPGEQEPYEDEKLCVFLIEKALTKLPSGKQNILVMFDLRGFQTHNFAIKLLPFLVKFCSAKAVREQYFTARTVPACFRD